MSVATSTFVDGRAAVRRSAGDWVPGEVPPQEWVFNWEHLNPGLRSVEVEHNLRMASWTDACLGGGGVNLGFALQDLHVADAVSHDTARYRPGPREIDHMDLVARWYSLLPGDVATMRRVLMLMTIWNDDRGRLVLSRNEVAKRIGCRPRALTKWYEDALGRMTIALARSPWKRARVYRELTDS